MRLVEELLELSAEIGVEGTVLFGVSLFLYALIGVIATTVVGIQTPYPFFSFEADPILLIDGTIVGVFTIQAAGSVLLYNFSVGVDNESVSSVVLSCIGLGIGGALLQTTLPEALELFVNFI